MKRDKIYTIPGKKELRQFGIIMGGMVILLFGVLLPFIFSGKSFYLVWVIGFAFIFLSYLAPSLLGPVYLAWMKFGLIMNKITTPILLGIVFYLIITPVGILMRIMGKEIMQSKTDKNEDTYRCISTRRTKDSLERPF